MDRLTRGNRVCLVQSHQVESGRHCCHCIGRVVATMRQGNRSDCPVRQTPFIGHHHWGGSGSPRQEFSLEAVFSQISHHAEIGHVLVVYYHVIAVFCSDRHLDSITLWKQGQGFEPAGKFPGASQGFGPVSIQQHISGKTRAVNPLHGERDIGLLEAVLRVVIYLDDHVLAGAKLAAFLPPVVS